MKFLVPFFSILASIVSIIAIVISLRWRHDQGIQDHIPGPNRPETPGQKALRVGASIWLVLFGVVMLLLAGAFVLPAIFKLFV